ncbi:MAG TPA: phosphoglucomutase/phosphomannomutase family protein [Dehalococcoidia bacterium]|nr:phosphoglucomutase/phosphomannomutase family protein [Dehalococcoidia bacterium]
MTNPIKFGTDGWRGIIAEDFTFDNVRICAQAIAEYLKQNGLDKQSLVIGYDTRFASEDFAAAATEVLAGNDIRVHLCLKPAPTPVVSFTVPATKSAGAIVITASHNPGSWNGFKYKSQDGASAPDEVTSQIERNIASLTRRRGGVKRLALDKALKKGVVDYLDPAPAYFEHLSHFVDIEELRRQKLNIIVDPMYGAGIGYFKTALQDGNLKITEINAERNPSFPQIQPEPIAKNLTKLSRLVVEQKADVGLATDGDADRIGIVDEKGQFLTQHQVFALLCLYLLEVRGERGAMIRTLTSTMMLSRLGKLFDVPVYETPVGFKYVAPLMMKKNAIIGGEESGGYGFRGHVPERDGILAGLYFLDFMVKTGKTPSQLLDYLYSKVGPHYYERRDFHISAAKRQTILHRLSSSSPDTIAGSKVAKVDTTDGFRFFLGDESWLLIRFSGTEPLVRIYSESESLERARELLDEGKKLIGL